VYIFIFLCSDIRFLYRTVICWQTTHWRFLITNTFHRKNFTDELMGSTGDYTCRFMKFCGRYLPPLFLHPKMLLNVTVIGIYLGCKLSHCQYKSSLRVVHQMVTSSLECYWNFIAIYSGNYSRPNGYRLQRHIFLPYGCLLKVRRNLF
jgi:hypothetical protein